MLKTICASLMKRLEENKILIVLSDGKPCDVSVKRPGLKQPAVYDEEAAVKDTAFGVCRARNQGISVIGICHEPKGIEVFVKDYVTAGDSVCDICRYLLPEGSELDEK